MVSKEAMSTMHNKFKLTNNKMKRERRSKSRKQKIFHFQTTPPALLIRAISTSLNPSKFTGLPLRKQMQEERPDVYSQIRIKTDKSIISKFTQ